MGRQKKTKHNEMRKVLKFSRLSLLGFSSLGVLGLLVLAMLAPTVSTDTHAESSTSREQRVNLNVQPVVSIAMDPAIEVDITPKAGGSTSSSTTEFKVSTNSDTGFKVYLKSGSASSNSLVNYDVAAEASTKEILATSKATTLSQFEANTWGYAVMEADTELSDSTVYQAVPKTVDNAIVETDKTNVNLVSGNSYKLAFGAKVDTSLPAGVYTNTVVVSAVANPIEVTSLSQLTYMQQMTSEICANTPSAMNDPSGASGSASDYYLNPVTKRLIDTRDGNMYWVAKLADGNCWMTQNLALNLGERPVDAPASYSRYVKTLTPGDSDVVSEWTVPASTTKYRVYDNPTNPMEPLDPEHPENTPIIEKTETITGTEVAIPRKDIRPNSEQANDTRSWNLGPIVSVKPTIGSLCTQPLSDDLANLGYTTDGAASSAWYGSLITETCSELYKNVSSLSPSDEPIATETSSIIDGMYDSHYLIGNYYQWAAATAQSELDESTNVTAGQEFQIKSATSSICPKGWKLPVTSRNTNSDAGWPLDEEGSFYQLLRAYGYPETGTSSLENNSTIAKTSWISNKGNAFTSIVDSDKTRLDFAPIYMLRAGSVSPYYGDHQVAGRDGVYWSATDFAGHSAASHDMDFGLINAFFASSAPNYVGQLVRCLAR